MENEFLNKENIEMLWEIIIDENLIKSVYDITSNNFKTFFLSQIQEFYIKNKLLIRDLFEFNKGFITTIINNTKYIKEQHKEQYKEKQLHHQKENITFKDIQMDKQSIFEKEYLQKKLDFQNEMTSYIPEPLNFKDNMDKPIIEMEELINKTLAERNFDTEQIYKKIQPPHLSTVQQKQEQQQQQQDLSSKFKYIKIDTKNVENINMKVIELPTEPQNKHITWAENIDTIEYKENNSEYNIFSKLKTNMKLQEPIESQNTQNSQNSQDIQGLSKRFDSLEEKINELYSQIILLKNTIENK